MCIRDRYDYEGVTPGHMNLFVHPSNRECVEKLGPFMEIDMDHPLEETIQKMIDHGGTLILDKQLSCLAKPLDDSKQSWEPHAVIEDPCGNYLYLWKMCIRDRPSIGWPPTARWDISMLFSSSNRARSSKMCIRDRVKCCSIFEKTP